jgi:hypothetical protein
VSTPGWYPDPTDANSIRYYDGSSWTEHVQAASRAETSVGLTQPASTSPPTASGPAPLGTSGGPTSTGTVDGRSSTGHREAIWLVIAAVMLAGVALPWLAGTDDGSLALAGTFNEVASSRLPIDHSLQVALCAVAAIACIVLGFVRRAIAALITVLVCATAFAACVRNGWWVLEPIIATYRVEQGLTGSIDIMNNILPGPGVVLPVIGALIGVLASLSMFGATISADRGTNRSIQPSLNGAEAAVSTPTAEPISWPGERPRAHRSNPTPAHGGAAIPAPRVDAGESRTPDQYGQW